MQARSEEFRDNAAECEAIAKQHGGPIKEQYEQLAGQWSFLTARTLIVRDPVLLAPYDDKSRGSNIPCVLVATSARRRVA
jgi:hypothetical protein